MEAIRNYIQQFTEVSSSDWDCISEKFQEVRFDANKQILEIGRTARYLYFQEEGFVRFYVYSDGIEVSRAFLPAPCFFTSRRSFNNQTPSFEGIHSLEQINGWRISFTDYEKLSNLNTWNKFMLALLNHSHDLMDDYLIELLSFDAKDKYQNLIDRYPPEYLDRIPLKYLASSIGIEPQSLSRIRKKLKD